jgi:hypothetical protein
VGRGLRLAGSLVAVATLALAVAALVGGPAAWAAPLAYAGEYPGAVGRLGPIPSFLGEFPARVPALPDFAAQHPPFATVFYARVGERVAVLCWALAPVTVLYLATSAVVLGLAGLVRAATGYDVVGAVAAVDDFWSHAPGTGQRVWWVWIFGDLLAFAVILGFPLTATLAALLAAACWATPAARSSACGSSWCRSRWWWPPASCCAGGPACRWWPACCSARPWPSRCCSTPAGSPQPRSPASSATAAPNTSVCRSTSASVVAGHIRAMLWNGVSRMPRLWRYRCR